MPELFSSFIRRAGKLDTPFSNDLCERRACHPSQNYTCDFSTYSSSKHHLIPAPDVCSDRGFVHIEVPFAVKTLRFHFALLVSAIKHSIVCKPHVLLKFYYRHAVTRYTVIVVVTFQLAVVCRHRISYRLCQSAPQPLLYRLSFRLQLLSTADDSNTIFTSFGFGIDERKAKKIKASEAAPVSPE